MLEDFLFPDENIKYQSPGEVMHAGDWFDLYITDQRIVVHKSYGFVFKKDRIIAERLEDIETLRYDEKGILSRTGILRVNTKTKRMVFQGGPHDMKAVWQELQKLIKRPGAPTQTVMVDKEKEVIVKEVVMVPCKYCGGLKPQASVFCPNCGAGTK